MSFGQMDDPPAGQWERAPREITRPIYKGHLQADAGVPSARVGKARPCNRCTGFVGRAGIAAELAAATIATLGVQGASCWLEQWTRA